MKGEFGGLSLYVCSVLHATVREEDPSVRKKEKNWTEGKEERRGRGGVDRDGDENEETGSKEGKGERAKEHQ